tara:strand:- start:514 stop:666 length:153 start_codon:yes stop_codon:yes gene_type:complete
MIIKPIIDLLNSSDFFGGTENIEIAKGKYELKKGLKEAFKQGKRLGYGKE